MGDDFKASSRQHTHQVVGGRRVAPQNHQRVARPHLLEALTNVQKRKRDDGVAKIENIYGLVSAHTGQCYEQGGCQLREKEAGGGVPAAFRPGMPRLSGVLMEILFRVRNRIGSRKNYQLALFLFRC